MGWDCDRGRVCATRTAQSCPNELWLFPDLAPVPVHQTAELLERMRARCPHAPALVRRPS